jgi:hypothetical protein
MKIKKITALLAIATDSTKFPPFLIFKGKSEQKIEKELSNLKEVKNKNINGVCQSKAWCDTTIFLKWYYNIFFFMKKI